MTKDDIRVFTNDGSLPRSSLRIAMPEGAKPPPAASKASAGDLPKNGSEHLPKE